MQNNTKNDGYQGSSSVSNEPKGIGSQSELDTDVSGVDQNEGEGNKTAARRYNKATEQYARSGKVPAKAREAAEALDDAEEGDQLREAEETAKRGIPDWGSHRR